MTKKMQNHAPRIEKTRRDGKTVWIKRPEQTRSSGFVLLHKLLAFILPSILQPSNAMGGMQALKDEANRLTQFAKHNIPAPKVIEISEDHLILSDTGMQLRHKLHMETDKAKQLEILLSAAHALHHIHTNGLVHGRPHIKDMTIDESDQISVLDLEEDPLKIMPKSDAQARDIWLFLSSSAEFFDDDMMELNLLLDILMQDASTEQLRSLQKLARGLRPFRKIIGGLWAKNISLDVRGAYYATRTLETL